MISRRIARFACLLSVAWAACAVSACAPDSQATGPFTGQVEIGLLTPVSGPHAAEGRAAVQGANLAVEMVNGSYPGIPLPLAKGTGLPSLADANVRLVTADTHSDPDRGARQAADLAARGVTGLVGAYDVDVTEAASQRTERTGVPFVNGDASARYLTDLGLEWFFRVGPSDRTYSEAFFSMLRQVESAGVKVRRVAVVRVDDDTSNDILGVIDQLAGEGGLEVGTDIKLDAGDATVTAADAAKLRRADADGVVLVASTVPDALALEKSLRSSGFDPPALITLGRGFDEAAFEAAIGKNGQGWMHPRAWSAEVAARNPAAKAAAELYQRTYKTPMTETAACSFTAVLTLAQAIDKAGSVERGDVRAALLALDVPGTEIIMPWSGIEFDDNRQNVRAASVIEQRLDGKPRVIYPTELARTQVSWPGVKGAASGKASAARKP